jgi:hypothetical protein
MVYERVVVPFAIVACILVFGIAFAVFVLRKL